VFAESGILGVRRALCGGLASFMQLVDIFFLMGVTVLLIGAGLTSLRTDATVLTVEPAAALRKEPATVFDEADVVAPPSPPGGPGQPRRVRTDHHQSKGPKSVRLNATHMPIHAKSSSRQVTPSRSGHNKSGEGLQVHNVAEELRILRTA
jgi:hypothetical protein